jgi:nucleotide-binding universal stress UspA family protein
MFKHIVVGVDGDEGGRDAVALARLLVAVGGKLTLAYVVARDAHAYRGTKGTPEASDGGRAEALLGAVRAETGVEARLRWYGSSSVGRGLHELCGVIGADLLVVGSSRRGLLGRVLIGDDTTAALNGAPCAVAIAPRNYSHAAAHDARDWDWLRRITRERTRALGGADARRRVVSQALSARSGVAPVIRPCRARSGRYRAAAPRRGCP